MLALRIAKCLPTAVDAGSGKRGSVTTSEANPVSPEYKQLTSRAREKNHMTEATSAVGKNCADWRLRCNSDRRDEEKFSFRPPIHAPRHLSRRRPAVEPGGRNRRFQVRRLRPSNDSRR